MKKEDVFTVKVYFIKPIDLIQVVINTLIELEYEVYTVAEQEADRLAKILQKDRRNIIFLCLTSAHEAGRWLEYAQKLQKLEHAGVQIGTFAYSSIDLELKKSFLMNQISVTPFSDLKERTLEVIGQILQIFEAKGSRRYVRAKAQGISQAFITVKGKAEAIKGQVVEISAFACLIEIDAMYRDYFQQGGFVPELLLALKGMRVRVAAKLLGFSKTNECILVFRYYGLELKDGKMSYAETISREVKQKLHKYISSCLRDNLKERLAAIEA